MKKLKKPDLFDVFPSRISLWERHQPSTTIPTKRFRNMVIAKWGADYEPQYFMPIIIDWSEKGRGFGEYVFYRDDKGRIFCDNEGDSREAVKRVLCAMVDQAIFREEMTPTMRAQEKRRYNKYVKLHGGTKIK